MKKHVAGQLLLQGVKKDQVILHTPEGQQHELNKGKRK
jgi:hypothetical protein